MAAKLSRRRAGSLLLDRFVWRSDGSLLDLATGRSVWARWSQPGPGWRPGPWMERCAELCRIRHRDVVSLVDFGITAEGHAVEVFDIAQAPQLWRGPAAVAVGVVEEVARFLRETGLCAALAGGLDVLDGDGETMVLPCSPAEPATARRPLQERHRARPYERRGVVLSWRAEYDRVLEVLDTGRVAGPRVLFLCGSRGSGIGTALGVLSREARLRGYVPVSTAALLPWFGRPRRAATAPLLRLLTGRHLLVWHDARDDGSKAMPRGAPLVRLLAGLAAAGRPHLVVVAVTRRCEPGVWFPTLDDRRRRHEQVSGVSSSALDSVAAESAEPYVVKATNVTPTLCADPGLGRARAQVRAGYALILRGRHARGAHLVRRALGALERRRETAQAGWVALTLGRLVLRRGQTSEAHRLLARARVAFERGGLASAGIETMIQSGLTHTDDDALQVAESTLRAALAAAEALQDLDRVGEARVGLARCMYWRGAADEAGLLVGRASDAFAGRGAVEPASIGPSLVREPALCGAGVEWEAALGPGQPDALLWREVDGSVAAAALATRVALHQGDCVAAAAEARRAAVAAGLDGAPLSICVAERAMAEVQVVVGDAEALLDHGGRGVRAARLAHAPLYALRVRLVVIDGLLRAGRPAEARRMLRQVARMEGALPGLLRRRLHEVRARCDAPAVVPGHRGVASGPAPAILVGARRLPQTGRLAPAWGDGPMLAEILEFLALAHEADDQGALLTRICERLIERLDAAAVEVIARLRDGSTSLASSGRRFGQTELADRVLALGSPIGPVSTGLGFEAGAPVRFGGEVAAVLVSRWAADRVPDPHRSSALLMAAASASAGAVRGALDRRVEIPPDGETVGVTLVGISKPMAELRQLLGRAAAAPYPVLITGESGTGKELAARAIHAGGPRRQRRFCALNCAALGDELVEAELFGHARGAFTGAVVERTGLFEVADGGTLFLDEVGELSPRAQAKLLRAVQDGEIRRIGENASRPTDVRLIAATNRPLHQDVRDGRFRQDLLYRLDVIRVPVPPLRNRPEDIPVLAMRFWDEARARMGSRAVLAPAAIAALARYDWPGNVRELQNVVAALAVSAPRRGTIGTDALPSGLGPLGAGWMPHAGTLEDARRRFEEHFVREALARAGGRRSQTAADLGLTRQGLAKLVTRLGIRVPP